MLVAFTTGGSMTNPKRDQAVNLLQHYVRLALPHPMSSDVYAEIESIVDLIIDSAVARSSSRPAFSVFPRSLGPVRGSASPRLFPSSPGVTKTLRGVSDSEVQRRGLAMCLGV